MALDTTIHWQGQSFKVNWQKGSSLAIPLQHGPHNPKAWHVNDPSFTPVRAGNFIGRVAEGGAVNFYNVQFNPHGNGTHTECVGHISETHHALSDCPIQPIAICQVLSAHPTEIGSDQIIRAAQVIPQVVKGVEAVAIRTLPNDKEKATRIYSNCNPPYFEAELLNQLAGRGIHHFLTDLPSVDQEEDAGLLAAHHAWWQYPEKPRLEATITEMIYLPDEVSDGLYLLNLMYPKFSLDAAPSQPMLYTLQPV